MLRERVNPTDAYALEWQIRQLQKGQHETFVFLGNLGIGISAERLAAGDSDGYDEVFLLLDDTDGYQGDVETRPAAHCLTISFRRTPALRPHAPEQRHIPPQLGLDSRVAQS